MVNHGRPSELDRRAGAEDSFREEIADYYVAGLTRREIADRVGISDVKTITRWYHDEKVQAMIAVKNRERANRIIRTVDSAIMAKLENPEERKKLPLKDLLDIRKTVAPTVVEVGRPGDQASADAAAWMAADQTGGAIDVTAVEEGPLELPPAREFE